MVEIIKSVDRPKQRRDKGYVLFEEGEPGNSFYIVKAGSVGVYHHYQKDDQIEIARIEAGQVIGEVAAIDGKPRTATAVVLEDETQIVEVDSKTLKHQLEHSPHWFSAIVLDLVERLRKTDELLISMGKKSLISSHEDQD